jgi:hypothetical protein
MSNAIEISEKTLPESLDDRSDLSSVEMAVTTCRPEVKESFHVCNSGDLVVIRGEGYCQWRGGACTAQELDPNPLAKTWEVRQKLPQ